MIVSNHERNAAFTKTFPYFHNGQAHDYMPDFIVRLNLDGSNSRHVILETKEFDPLEGVKRAAAERWVKAVNSDSQFGYWQYAMARRPEEVITCLASAVHQPERELS